MKPDDFCDGREKAAVRANPCRRMGLTRREFLRVVGGAMPAALLGACSPALVGEEGALPVAPAPLAAGGAEYIKPEMIRVEPGSFEMGSAKGEADEQPVHTVRIARAFLIARYEATFDDYDRFSEEAGLASASDEGYGRGQVPVQNVDWYSAVAFCNWLSEKEGLTPCYSGRGKATICDFSADGYRLPTEAEWEYAARGGQRSRAFAFAGSDDPDPVAWYDANSDGRTHPIGEKAANELGLYDMSGNVFEWCWDWYARDYYSQSAEADPQGPPPPATSKPWEWIRARRSGCWRESAQRMRVTARSYDTANYAGENGFRLARTA